MEDYQKALEHIFAYGHGCCAFKHSIHGDWPGIPDGMPDSVDPLSPKYFVNLGCLSAQQPSKPRPWRYIWSRGERTQWRVSL